MKNSSIEWTDHTFNPWIGCTKVSPGCDHCYAEATMDKRLHKVQWGTGQPRQRTSEAYWSQPLKWNKERYMQCAACGWRGAAAAQIIGCGQCGSLDIDDTRARVFCASLADLADNEVPTVWRQHLMSRVADTPNLDWLVLTKRIGNARQMLSDASMHDGRLLTANDEYRPPSNLWIGATIVNRDELVRDAAKLKTTPAAKHFWSVEPMLGDLGHILKASGVGATIELSEAESLLGCSAIWPCPSELAHTCILSGGDDYEPVFTAPSHARDQVQAASSRSQTAVTRIGTIRASAGIEVFDRQGQPLTRRFTSFDHFADA